MTNKEFKIKFLNHLLTRDIWIQKKSNNQFVTRCPYCGDTQKRQNDGHLYLKINPNDNKSIVYNCFRCPAGGMIKDEDLEYFGITDTNMMSAVKHLNQTSDKSRSNDEVEDKFFDFIIPNPTDMRKIKYVEDRLGMHISDELIQKFKIITSLRSFMIANNLTTITCKPEMARYVDKDFVGFLSNNGSYILFRNIKGGDIRWYKYPILEESIGQKVDYSIETSVDLFTKDNIIINLSEGIIDAISIHSNLNNDKENIINIAVCGKYYIGMIKRLFHMGFIGPNITINIYSDNDGAKDTSLDYFSKLFDEYRYLVKDINILYNLKSKDCGVPKEEILIQKHRLK